MSTTSGPLSGLRKAMGMALVTAAAVAGNVAVAQPYPQKPIRVIVNSAPGGLTDVIARIMGTKMGLALGQPLVIDNKPGGGGLIGAELVAKAPPDGYTIGVVASAITASPFMVANSPFDASKDVAPVVLLMSTPLVLVTNINSPYKTLGQYVSDARARPDAIAFASGGAGTMTHLLAEQLQVHAGIKLVHVPYKGGGPALNDVLAGHVPVYFDTLNTSTKLIQDNRLRALAIVSPTRSPALPNVPTIAEAGFPEVQGMSWFAIVAPAGTPREIVARLNTEIGKILRMPDIRERFSSLGADIAGGSAEDFAAFQRREVARWTKIVEASGAKIE
jgi:tripartite-type tricarboxylate transporter receptor subunit TctC